MFKCHILLVLATVYFIYSHSFRFVSLKTFTNPYTQEKNLLVSQNRFHGMSFIRNAEARELPLISNSSLNDMKGDIFDIDIMNESDVDIDLVTDSVIDHSIEKVVKQMLGEPEKGPDFSPLDTFNDIYNELKAKKSTDSSRKLNATDMLERLFPDDQTGEPFDERKVMIKLRNILDSKDFEELFKDPSIGDWL